MLGALLWGIGASMALAEENEKAKTKNVEEQLESARQNNAFEQKKTCIFDELLLT